MPIPDFQTFMLPLLKFAGDGKEHHFREAIDALATEFSISEEDRKELLPSGQQPIIDNRIGWAKTFMKKAGLLETPRRGMFQISERGKSVLKQNPEKIDNKYLSQFSEFVEFRTTRHERNEIIEIENGDDTKTPQESIEYGYQRIRKDLAQDLLTNVKNCTPKFFEKLVVEMLLKMGYGGSLLDAGKAIGKSGDGGIDGIIKEDKLGLDVIYIQAKRWDGSVGSKEVRNFVGSLVGQKANKGVFITTSSFTKEALQFVSTIQHKVILIDGEQLAQYMIDYDIGVAKVTTYEIKRVDTDYFAEE